MGFRSGKAAWHGGLAAPKYPGKVARTQLDVVISEIRVAENPKSVLILSRQAILSVAPLVHREPFGPEQ